MSDVFISYKAEDRRRIQPLVQALQADGYSVWWDEHIGTGDAWRQTIEKQLDSARLTLLGKTAEAKQAYSLVPPDNVYRMTGEAIIEARTGNTAGAMQRLSRLRDLYGDSAVYQQAQVLAQLRQVDGAVAALERSFVVKDPGLLSMAADPFLDPVRNDPQFGELLKKMKFPS